MLLKRKKTHLGCRYERGEYERGRHSGGTGEQVRLAVVRPLVQREWLSASQLLAVCAQCTQKKSTCVYCPCGALIHELLADLSANKANGSS
jgi:hypothetical protein